jgi:hypothetical protein
MSRRTFVTHETLGMRAASDGGKQLRGVVTLCGADTPPEEN